MPSGAAPTGDVFDHPERIGPYRILQVIGEGGMGVVYEAEQTEPVRRRVALKVMKIGMDTKDVVARFEAERQALAVMEHPSIAKVLDAGASETGRPYFVMEHVRGMSITQYCDMQKLSTHERLELFIAVCDAVQHAHQKGVIHRDLKPSNVLVTEQAGSRVPKIIDFGIAKATGQRLTNITLVTSFGQALGTPAYMSPEQAEMSGLDVDTRTDIYSLGVMLYELLVGKLPMDPDELGMSAFIARLVMRDTNPLKPSAKLHGLGTLQHTIAQARQTDTGGLLRELKGDLDWIVLKAMDPDRSQRYQTANALAFELKRYLNEEPILARPPSATYRFKKFVRRNKATVAASAAVVLALVLGVILATGGMVHATRAERRAATEAETARQVSDFLKGLFEVSDPGEALGDRITARELLDRGADRITTELSDQPLVQARLLRTMGEVYKSLGLYEQALPMLQQAVELNSEILSADDPEVAESVFQLARLFHEQGRYNETEQLYRRTLVTQERILDRGDVRIATTLDALGNVYAEQGRLDEAEPLLRRALAIREAGSAPDSPALATSMTSLASLYTKQGKYAAADSLFVRALAIREAALGPNHPAVAFALNNLGGVRWLQGRYDDAEQFMRRSLEVRMLVLGPDHPDLGDILLNLGALYWMQEKYAEAAPLYDRAREIWEDALGPNHRKVAMALNNLAETYWVQGDTRAAEPLFRRALAIKEEVLEPDNTSIAITVLGLANVYRDQQRFALAEPLYRRAAAIRESAAEVDKPRLAETLREYAKLLRAMNRPTEAAQLEARADTLAGE